MRLGGRMRHGTTNQEQNQESRENENHTNA